MKSPDSHSNIFRIGAVANITGLSTHTIRAWERRYGMDLSDRSEGGTRLYPEDSVKRLTLIKALLDNGESISMLCDLTLEELEKRLEGHGGPSRKSTPPTRTDGPVRIVTFGPHNLTRKIYKPDAFVTAQILLQTTSESELRNFLKTTDEVPNCGILYCDIIPTHLVDMVFDLAGKYPEIQWFVIFELGSKRELLMLSEKGIRTLRGPIPDTITIDLITAILRPGVATEASETESASSSPQPIFTPAQLIQLTDLPSSIKCECPSHMSAIIHSLNTFEKYCKSCENDSEEDAALHAELGRETARARVIMEKMLLKVCAHDNIRLQ